MSAKTLRQYKFCEFFVSVRANILARDGPLHIIKESDMSRLLRFVYLYKTLLLILLKRAQTEIQDDS
jgi:hypothetical protein